MHIMTSQAGMLSVDGRCHTFDQRANGFVPGEGVGVLMLKRLHDAERANDRILGVIEGWGVNQDGKTNGITAPSTNSQIRLQQDVFERFNIDPASIQLIEAHGTGTKLGDPIEIDALKAAYASDSTHPCAIGSVKSNIGHCLTAAGVSGVIKLLLAIQHKQLPPTINFERVNEHIELDNSPFFINDSLQAWQVKPGEARRAAVSSFGFSGTNANLVIAEHQPRDIHYRVPPLSSKHPEMILLSAQTDAQLHQKARDLLHALQQQQTQGQQARLVDIAYTLQVGREGMEYRWATVVDSVAQLQHTLNAFINRIEDSDDYHAERAQADCETQAQWRELSRVQQETLRAWFAGDDIDWHSVQQAHVAQHQALRIALPGYPFADEHYWLPEDSIRPLMSPAVHPANTPNHASTHSVPSVSGVNSVSHRHEHLHPLLQRNVSDLTQQRFYSRFSGEEFFLADHQVKGQKILPAVAYLEMARRAALASLPASVTQQSTISLHNSLWAQPIIVDAPTEVYMQLRVNEINHDLLDFDVSSEQGMHSQGQISVTPHTGNNACTDPLNRVTNPDDPRVLRCRAHLSSVCAFRIRITAPGIVALIGLLWARASY